MDFEAFQDFDSANVADISLEGLPDVWPRFSISVLPEKPQDPIMDTVRLWSKLRHADLFGPLILSERDKESKSQLEGFAQRSSESNLWTRAATEPRKPSVRQFPPRVIVGLRPQAY